MLVNRKACMLGQKCHPRTWKERVHCVILHSGFGIHELAERLHRRSDRLYAYANPNQPDQIPAIDVIGLTRETGRIDLLEHLAAECGYLVVPAPPATVSREDLFAATAAAMKELSDAVDAVRMSFVDGRVTPIEANRFHEEFIQAQAAIARLEALAVQQIVDHAPPSLRSFRPSNEWRDARNVSAENERQAP